MKTSRAHPYRWTASALSARMDSALPMILMTLMSMRFPQPPGGRGTTAPRALLRAAWDDAGYCLDAPETLPAGGCEFYPLPPDDDEDEGQADRENGLPVQLTISREAMQ